MKTAKNILKPVCGRGTLWVIILCVVMGAFAVTGCGDDDDSRTGYVGICDVCGGDGPCDEGWCAAFEGGQNRCVPDDIGAEDPYTCRIPAYIP